MMAELFRQSKPAIEQKLTRAQKMAMAILPLLFASGGLLWAPAQPAAQTRQGRQPAASPSAKPTETLRVRSQLVIVDVTVADHDGRPVHGLKKSDFRVLEDGKPQHVVAFEHHVFQPHAAPRPAVKLPKGEYSNLVLHRASVPTLNIILFDVLNTPLAGQMDGRRKLVQFLKTLPHGQPTALFILTEHLKMVASFSSDTSHLVAAAKKLLPYKAAWRVSEEEAERDTAQYNELAKLVDAGNLRARVPMPFVDAGRAVKGRRSLGLYQRALSTADAFDVLAHVLAGYPGRKNVLWLSSGFPLSFDPLVENRDPHDFATEKIALPDSTAALLASSQVAVYPIEITGLDAIGASATTPSATLDVPPQTPSLKNDSRHVESRSPDPYASLTSTRESWLMRSQQMMKKIADDTGGKAFMNTNDLKSALRRAVESGSNYYSLAYVPRNDNWNGAYRHIKVKVDRRGLKLAYRRGYYATRKARKPAEFSHSFVQAMLPGVPVSSMLPFLVRVLPPDSGHHMVRIGYAIPAQNIAFKDSKDGRKHGAIKVVVVPYGKDGHPRSVMSRDLKLNLKPATYTQVLNSGILLRQAIHLSPGDFDLRIGVQDESTGSFGTISVPLKMP